MTAHVGDLVEIPGGPFLLGADYGALPETLRAAHEAKRLGLGAVLDSTPPYWVEIPTYRIQARMVANLDYHAFLTAPHPDQVDTRDRRGYVDDYDLWAYIWDLFKVEKVPVPGTEPGPQQPCENYTGCGTAIDALIRSYAYEADQLRQRVLAPNDPSHGALARDIVRSFACLRRGLAHVVWSGEPELEYAERQALTDDDTAEGLLASVERVLNVLEAKLIPSMVSKVPLVTILRRLRRLLMRATETWPVTWQVADCFYPLVWTEDEMAGRKIRAQQLGRMPWVELPVRGVSCYEVAAYAAWMCHQTGKTFTLPSEAEYEKAFGWDGSWGVLAPQAKHIYPWLTHHESDFNYYFGRHGARSVQALEANARQYRELLQKTARIVDGQKLYQGVGFGWQWTRERFNEHERKYNRFEDVNAAFRTEGDVRIYEYQEHQDYNCRAMAVRGASDLLGGPGTVTRRFALSPLRGYEDCGFRLVQIDDGGGL